MHAYTPTPTHTPTHTHRKYVLVPALLYAFERWFRVFRSYRNVPVHSVMLMEPRLIAIEMSKIEAFGPDGFREVRSFESK